MSDTQDCWTNPLEDVEELHQALCDLYRDPVDVFEDLLARELGISRPAAMNYRRWRRYRVEAIERESLGGGMILPTARAGAKARRTKKS